MRGLLSDERGAVDLCALFTMYSIVKKKSGKNDARENDAKLSEHCVLRTLNAVNADRDQ